MKKFWNKFHNFLINKAYYQISSFLEDNLIANDFKEDGVEFRKMVQ